jgi:hypothetical protein
LTLHGAARYGTLRGAARSPHYAATVAGPIIHTADHLRGAVEDDRTQDHYEALQISPNAETETIHRVYRLLAARFHPDNRETGNEERFRALHEAYNVLSDPTARAQYDLVHKQRRPHRWQAEMPEPGAGNDFDLEQLVRLTVLEALYRHRREETNGSGIFVLDLEQLTGHSRERLEFTVWYLSQKRYVQRGDNSRLLITADGVDYFERHHQMHLTRRRLRAA